MFTKWLARLQEIVASYVDVLTGSSRNHSWEQTNIDLNNAEDIANHFNCHFTQIGPRPYPGYQRFFSRAVGIFGVGRRPKPRAAKPRGAARVTIKTWEKPETALEKSLAPRVPRPLLQLFSLRFPNEAEIQRLVPESLIDWCKICWNLKQDEQELKNLE